MNKTKVPCYIAMPRWLPISLLVILFTLKYIYCIINISSLLCTLVKIFCFNESNPGIKKNTKLLYYSCYKYFINVPNRLPLLQNNFYSQIMRSCCCLNIMFEILLKTYKHYTFFVLFLYYVVFLRFLNYIFGLSTLSEAKKLL